VASLAFLAALAVARAASQSCHSMALGTDPGPEWLAQLQAASRPLPDARQAFSVTDFYGDSVNASVVQEGQSPCPRDPFLLRYRDVM
jgi:hypothetical protein